MKIFFLYPVLLVFCIIFCSGCVLPSSTATPGTSAESNSSDIYTSTIAVPVKTISPDTRQDPIVGTWVCRSYLANGILKKEYRFLANNTWTRVNTNLESRVQGFAKGTWGKDSDTNYWIKLSAAGEPHPFQYDKTNDTLYEPGFRETFYRVPESSIRDKQVPSMKITVYSAQKVTKIPPGARPQSGFNYLLLDVEVKNINEKEGFSYDDKSVRVLYDDGPGSYAQNAQLEGRINNPLTPGLIGMGESCRGTAVFAIPESSSSCIVKLIDNEGDLVSNIIELKDLKKTEF